MLKQPKKIILTLNNTNEHSNTEDSNLNHSRARDSTKKRKDPMVVINEEKKKGSNNNMNNMVLHSEGNVNVSTSQRRPPSKIQNLNKDSDKKGGGLMLPVLKNTNLNSSENKQYDGSASPKKDK